VLSDLDRKTRVSGSIIGCEDQTLGETIPIAGTPYSLHYQSERTPGRKDNRQVAVNSKGELYVSDWLSGHVRKVDANGVISTVLGGGLSELRAGSHCDRRARSPLFPESVLDQTEHCTLPLMCMGKYFMLLKPEKLR